jgi:hypothetical protein
MHSIYCINPGYTKDPNPKSIAKYIELKVGKKTSKMRFNKWATMRYKTGTEVLREKKFPVSSGRDGSLSALEGRIIRRLINKGFKRSEFKREHFIVHNNDFAKTMFLSIVDREINKGL